MTSEMPLRGDIDAAIRALGLATTASELQGALLGWLAGGGSADNDWLAAVMADPAWQGGDYYGTGQSPDAGLSVARMAAHITYLSEASLTEKFGRRLQDRAAKSFGFDADFEVESYLRYQGVSFTGRFDANSYLYITRAMSYFDLAETFDQRLRTGRLCRDREYTRSESEGRQQETFHRLQLIARKPKS